MKMLHAGKGVKGKAFREGIPMHLEKQAFGPHRVNGYIRYMASRVGRPGAAIPQQKKAQGEPDVVHKQAVAA